MGEKPKEQIAGEARARDRQRRGQRSIDRRPAADERCESRAPDRVVIVLDIRTEVSRAQVCLELGDVRECPRFMNAENSGESVPSRQRVDDSRRCLDLLRRKRSGDSTEIRCDVLECDGWTRQSPHAWMGSKPDWIRVVGLTGNEKHDT